MSQPPLSGDAVIYQNWLMKRSQVTRMFKRRFTILTASGKLYSFRRADLGKPESIHLSQASLVWDIRGCSIEYASKIGRGVWVLKPTGPNLKEEIYLKVCPPFTISATEHWMGVMLAVARNNIQSLFDPSRTSVLSVAVQFYPDNSNIRPDRLVLYAEIEGSLRNMDFDGKSTYRTETHLKDSDPASCIVIRQYSSENGGEVPIANSQMIPRFKAYKSKTTFPWTTPRAVDVSLTNEYGSTLKRGLAHLRVDEGVRDYTAPFISRHLVDADPGIDFGLFKFQIKRLVRLIGKIGATKSELIKIFEWKNNFISTTWLVYLTVVFLVFPRFIPPLLLCHLCYFSLLNSVEFQAWWELSPLRKYWEIILLTFSDDTIPETVPILTPTLSAANSRRESLVAKVTKQDTSGASTTLRQTTSSSTVASSLKEAAVCAINQVMTNRRSGASIANSSIKSEIWENQRRTLGGSQFHASNLSVFDRSRWSDESGKIPLEPPSNAEWKIDVDAPNSDENGWAYNMRWGGIDWHPEFTSWDYVRRRRWLPVSGASVVSPRLSLAGSPPMIPRSVDLQPIELTEDDFDEDQSRANATLSGVVTSGPEYGNLQDDYDDSNIDLQPKQTGGIGSMFTEFKQTAIVAQLEIGEVCNYWEKYLNLFSWKDELVSTVATASVAIGVCVLLFIPLNIIIYVAILSQFNQGYRRKKWTQVAIKCALEQYVRPLLPNRKLSSLGGLEAHKLCLAINKRTGANLTQKLLADMNSPERLAEWICKQSSAFVAMREWMRRDFLDNFIDHIPLEVSEEHQVFFSDTTKSYIGSSPPSLKNLIEIPSHEAAVYTNYDVAEIAEQLEEHL